LHDVNVCVCPTYDCRVLQFFHWSAPANTVFNAWAENSRSASWARKMKVQTSAMIFLESHSKTNIASIWEGKNICRVSRDRENRLWELPVRSFGNDHFAKLYDKKEGMYEIDGKREFRMILATVTTSGLSGFPSVILFQDRIREGLIGCVTPVQNLVWLAFHLETHMKDI
jgi:hypothetical protein